MRVNKINNEIYINIVRELGRVKNTHIKQRQNIKLPKNYFNY